MIRQIFTLSLHVLINAAINPLIIEEGRPLNPFPTITGQSHHKKNKNDITGHTIPLEDSTNYLIEDFIINPSERVMQKQEKNITRDEDIEADQQNYLNSIFEFVTDCLDYRREIPDGSVVFCQGSAAFKAAVKAACREKKKVCLYFDQ